MLGGLGLILVIIGGYSLFSKSDFEKEGVPATATIIKKFDLSGMSVDGFPIRSFMVTLQFDDTTGNTQTHDLELHEVYWKTLRENETLEIIYLPETPAQLTLAKNVKSGTGEASVLMIAGIGAMALGAILWWMEDRNKTRLNASHH